MIQNVMHGKEASLRADLLVVVFLVGLDVAARLLLHTPNFTPVMASALFAGIVLRRRALALLVPLAAMAISDGVIGFDDWRLTGVIYAALMLPAAAGILARRYPSWRALVPTALACSLMFFATTNFSVWLFSGMYAADMAGLITCYVAALPFLKYTVAGDLVWVAVLFGGAWLVQGVRSRASADAAVSVAS